MSWLRKIWIEVHEPIYMYDTNIFLRLCIRNWNLILLRFRKFDQINCTCICKMRYIYIFEDLKKCDVKGNISFEMEYIICIIYIIHLYALTSRFHPLWRSWMSSPTFLRQEYDHFLWWITGDASVDLSAVTKPPPKNSLKNTNYHNYNNKVWLEKKKRQLDIFILTVHGCNMTVYAVLS